MAQAGKTTIQLYRSSTSSEVPNSGNLVAGELAINTADMALYAENASGTVKKLINNPAGLKYPTTDGTANQAVTTDGSGNLSFATTGGSPSIQAVASGSLSNGDKVVVNSDGTVSVIAQTVGPPSAGTEVVFNSASTFSPAIAYDSANQKVVIAYRDNGTTTGLAVVGTVSGTSISFGTPATFYAGLVEYVSIAYNSNAQKVVIAYRNPSLANKGYARVGTVSGTSISFGTNTQFSGANVDFVSIAYDSGSQQVVIAYRDRDDFYGKAIVGAVSGTSISFGAISTFNSRNLQFVCIAYDSNAGKIVISYSDEGGGNGYGTSIIGTVSGNTISFGTKVVFVSSTIYETAEVYDPNAQKIVVSYGANAIVGTVSGTSISFGSPTTFDSNAGNASLVYDASVQKILIAYTDYGNSQYGTAIVGTVSGTSISFGTKSVFNSGTTNSIFTAYDSVNQKVVTTFRDESNSNYGVASVITTQSLVTNLTSENYIGISSAAYTNGQTAVIQSTGAVDDAQSGLTAGQSYYVQPDGTLGLSPGTPSVFAGTALSATKILVKG